MDGGGPEASAHPVVLLPALRQALRLSRDAAQAPRGLQRRQQLDDASLSLRRHGTCRRCLSCGTLTPAQRGHRVQYRHFRIYQTDNKSHGKNFVMYAALSCMGCCWAQIEDRVKRAGKVLARTMVHIAAGYVMGQRSRWVGGGEMCFRMRERPRRVCCTRVD